MLSGTFKPALVRDSPGRRSVDSDSAPAASAARARQCHGSVQPVQWHAVTLKKMSVAAEGPQWFKRASRGLFAGVKKLTGNHVSPAKNKVRRVWLPNAT